MPLFMWHCFSFNLTYGRKKIQANSKHVRCQILVHETGRLSLVPQGLSLPSGLAPAWDGIAAADHRLYLALPGGSSAAEKPRKEGETKSEAKKHPKTGTKKEETKVEEKEAKKVGSDVWHGAVTNSNCFNLHSINFETKISYHSLQRRQKLQPRARKGRVKNPRRHSAEAGTKQYTRTSLGYWDCFPSNFQFNQVEYGRKSVFPTEIYEPIQGCEPVKMCIIVYFMMRTSIRKNWQLVALQIFDQNRRLRVTFAVEDMFTTRTMKVSMKKSGWKTILSFWNGPFLGDICCLCFRCGGAPRYCITTEAMKIVFLGQWKCNWWILNQVTRWETHPAWWK